MKSILKFGAIMIALSVAFVSCQKDDTTDPIITLKGNSSITISLNSTYTDQGATANDDEDGDISSKITTDNPVNANLTGTYTVTYSVSDEAGNTATAKRTVIVKNDAASLEGGYSVTDVCSGAGTTNYDETVTASKTVNNRIIFTRFANYTGANTVYANVTGSNIDVPTQTAIQVGNPAADRQFSGTGSTSSVGFTITYTELTNGTSTTCTGTYIKK